MQLLSNADIDNICRRAADYVHTWSYVETAPSDILDFYLIDLFRNLYNTGLRFTELTDPTRWSENEAGNLICQSAKGSDPRTFNPIELSDYFISCLYSDTVPYNMCLYTTAVRYFKKVIYPKNVVFENGGISLHIFRHNKVKQMQDDHFSIQEISDFLGEVSNTNTEIYANSKIYMTVQ
jgi:hypothetical protein